jgi:hypothetical protein
MKTLRIFLVGLLVATTSLFAVSAKAADTSVTLSCVTFSWPDTIYRPLSGSVVFNLSYKNNCTYEVLSAKYTLVDKFGSSLETEGLVGLKAGVTANQSQSWYESFLSRGTEPFTLRFSVEHFSSFGISNPAPVSVPFKFAERTTVLPTPAPTVTVTATPAPAPTVTVTATPAPAPTVTVTATPAPAPTVYITNPSDKNLTDLVSSLKSQVSLLNAKVKRICSVKPKPKGC